MSEQEQVDLSGLTAKRDELLGEVRKLKSRVVELEGERDVAVKRAEEAEADVKRVTIDEPVNSLLADLFTVPLKYVREGLGEHFQFKPGDDGKMQFLTADGEPVKIDDRPAEFTQDDVYKVVRGLGQFDEVLRGTLSSGGGAPGGGKAAINQEAPRAPRVAPRLGLR